VIVAQNQKRRAIEEASSKSRTWSSRWPEGEFKLAKIIRSRQPSQ
jgi:hypothetical protein